MGSAGIGLARAVAGPPEATYRVTADWAHAGGGADHRGSDSTTDNRDPANRILASTCRCFAWFWPPLPSSSVPIRRTPVPPH